MTGHRCANGRRRRVPGMMPHDSESPYTRICFIGSASNRESLRGAHGKSAVPAGSQPSWPSAWPSSRPSPDDPSFPRGTRRPSTALRPELCAPSHLSHLLHPLHLLHPSHPSHPSHPLSAIAPRRISYADSRFTAVSYFPPIGLRAAHARALLRRDRPNAAPGRRHHRALHRHRHAAFLQRRHQRLADGEGGNDHRHVETSDWRRRSRRPSGRPFDRAA